MFEWYWFFLFYAIIFHLNMMAMSLYVHRTVAHNMFKLSKPLEYFFRVVLWLSDMLPRSSRWAEYFAARHRKHHVFSDTKDDPQSPHHMTLKEMAHSYTFNEDDIAKYSSEIKTPNDWLQRVLQEKYRYLGPWLKIVVSGLLFGVIGGLIYWAFHYFKINSFLTNFIGGYAIHKIGFRYAGNRNKHDRSTILFPVGILLAGEELHANHHNDSKSPNFRKKWFEFDMGYVYAVILSKFKLLTINDYKQGKT